MNDLELALERLCKDPRYLRNLDWGTPRSGHPEGTIRAHIAELEHNLKCLGPRVTEIEAVKLKLLIHTHDTFKPDAAPNVAILHPQSHASLARRFLAEFCDDADFLAMVQWHDEPYALWLRNKRSGFDAERFKALLKAIRDWNLFTAFLIIDGCTPGKDRTPLLWFFRQVAGRVKTSFSASDLL